MSDGSYYYQCAELVDEPTMVHCTRGTNGFKPLALFNWADYRKMTCIVISRAAMDRKHYASPVGLPLNPITSLFATWMGGTTTGEAEFLKSEFPGKRVIMIDNKKSLE
jgi:hypothetical protein